MNQHSWNNPGGEAMRTLMGQMMPGGWMMGTSRDLDQARAQLDLRYARGEIDRDDYLQRRADLTGTDQPAQRGPQHFSTDLTF